MDNFDPSKHLVDSESRAHKLVYVGPFEFVTERSGLLFLWGRESLDCRNAGESSLTIKNTSEPVKTSIDSEMVRVLLSDKNHNTLDFSDDFVRYLSVQAPEVVETVDPDVEKTLIQSELELLKEHPEWLSGVEGDPDAYFYRQYGFTKLEDGRSVHPSRDLTLVRTHPVVLSYVERHGASSFFEGRLGGSREGVAFKIIEVPREAFACVCEGEDGTEYVSKVHPLFLADEE